MEYTVDGRGYSERQLLNYVHDQLESQRTPEWKREVAQFIAEWLSSSHYIEVHTSGSTGKPKRFQAKKTHVATSARRTVEFFNLQRGATVLLALPVHYIAGKLMVVRALEHGLDLRLTEPKLNPIMNLDESIDFVALTPTQAAESLTKLDQVKTAIIGGAPLTDALIRQLKSVKAICYATYGMTETLTHIALRKLNPRPDQYYRALPGVDLTIHSNNQLQISVPDIDVHNLKTNDVVELKGDSSFRFLGRADHVINTGGKKLHPELLEAKLEGHIKMDFFVTAQPNQRFGEVPVLVLVGAPPHEPKLFLSELNQLLTPHEQLKGIYTVDHADRTASGKLKRSATAARIQWD